MKEKRCCDVFMYSIFLHWVLISTFESYLISVFIISVRLLWGFSFLRSLWLCILRVESLCESLMRSLTSWISIDTFKGECLMGECSCEFYEFTIDTWI